MPAVPQRPPRQRTRRGGREAATCHGAHGRAGRRWAGGACGRQGRSACCMAPSLRQAPTQRPPPRAVGVQGVRCSEGAVRYSGACSRGCDRAPFCLIGAFGRAGGLAGRLTADAPCLLICKCVAEASWRQLAAGEQLPGRAARPGRAAAEGRGCRSRGREGGAPFGGEGARAKGGEGGEASAGGAVSRLAPSCSASPLSRRRRRRLPLREDGGGGGARGEGKEIQTTTKQKKPKNPQSLIDITQPSSRRAGKSS